MKIFNNIDLKGNNLLNCDNVPSHVALTKEEYDELVCNNELDEDTIYEITDDFSEYTLPPLGQGLYFDNSGRL